jgi:hypothetical protein
MILILDIYVYFDGRFSIIFDDKEPGTVGTFLVIYQGKKYIPPETVIIENGVYTYVVDLHVDTEGGGQFDPFEEGWMYRKMITVNHESVAGNLIDFPVLISTTDDDLRDKAQDDGDDILFMYDVGNASKLYHEIELFDKINGELVVWVNVPILFSTNDTVFYMYYGNQNCDSQEKAEDVWDSNFCGVWHLDNLNESTINNNNGTNYGTDELEGKIGNCRDFVKNNSDYIDLGDMPEPADSNITTATFEAWINPKDLDEGATIISKMDKYGFPDLTSYTFYFLNSGKIHFGVASGTWYPQGRSIGSTTNEICISSNVWQYIVAVVNLQSKDIDIFYNGEKEDSTLEIFGTPPAYFYDIDLNECLGIWRLEAGHKYYNGSIDEVRISKICRSAEWISTQYNNQNDSACFLSFSPEEVKSPPNSPIIDGPDSGKPGEEYFYKFAAQDPNSDDIYLWIDWGDGDTSGWIGPYKSGEGEILNHTWTSQGTYTIKAKAKDTYDAESDWTTLTVTIPRDKEINKQFLNFFTQQDLTIWLLKSIVM